jgi:TonB family protein
MAFLSASVPKKVSDNQFIGDLMNLFERRKIKCGDATSLENFAATLSSNDALRSQLFTLCTAISHMAAEDLSGEQLLELVARALGGPGLPKRGQVVEIPESMRTAFLSGYEAWSTRGMEPKQPLAWPITGKAEERSEAATAVAVDEPKPAAEASAPTAAEPAAVNRHTVQEALDIARERRLAETAGSQGAAASGVGANLEGLTVSELKALLQEVEQQVQRVAAPVIDEARFLARHAYLQPGRKTVVGHAGMGAGPVAGVANARGTVVPVVAVPEAVGVAAIAPPVVEPIPVAVAAGPAVAAVPPVAAVPAVAVVPEPIPYREPVERFDSGVTRLRVSSGAMALVVGGCALFLLVVSGLAGVLVYGSLHPKTVDDFPELKAAAGAQSSVGAGYAAGGTQLIVSTQIDPTAGGYAGHAPRAVAAKPQAAVQQAAPVGVWPNVRPAVLRDSAMERDAAVASVNAALPRADASVAPVSVASANLMKYAVAAPQPAYPADEPRGINGTVVVQVTVSKEGKVTGIRAVSGPEELRPATVRAVEEWRFRPYLINGSAADVVTTLGFVFRGE